MIIRVLTYLLLLHLPAAAGSLLAEDIGDIKTLSVEPADSVQEANQRIWLGIERRNSCRVSINILGDSSRVIRHLFDRLLPAGYYNFYWDKQDDSGRYVEPGQYRYVVKDCGNFKDGILTAGYITGEREIRIYNEDPDAPGVVPFEVSTDSIPVSITVYRHRKLVDTPVQDSLFLIGRHEFIWQPTGRAAPGTYRIELRAGDFTHHAEFTRPR